MNGGSSETIEAEGLLATSVLDADNVPNENQSENCFSCKTPMTGLYCTTCGQKNDDFRRSIFSLGLEAISSIFSLESRMWRTWWALLTRPGRVAREFADGKRTQWSSPIRVYLAMSLLLFGYIAITHTQLISLDINVQKRAVSITPEENVTLEDLHMTFGVTMFETKHKIDQRNANRNFDYIQMVFENSDHNFQLRENGFYFTKKKPTEINENEDISENGAAAPINNKDIDAQSQSVPATEPTNNYVTINRKKVDISGGALQKSVIKFMRDPSDFNDTFSTYLPRIMFLMMPFTMFLGAIFIRGRGNAFLYDHLVHAAYIHAVLFFLLLTGLIFGRIPLIPNQIVILTILLYITFYLPISLFKMFKRGPIKTIWTSYGVALVYLIVMLTIVLALTSFGLQDYFDTL